MPVSQRGAVFFRKQDNLTNDLQKQLILRIGQLSGRPSTSGLHVHPVLNSEGEVGEQRDPDQEISTISSKLFTKVYGRSPDGALCQKKQTADQWHSDIAFEPVPADYSSLRLTEVPKTGGGMFNVRRPNLVSRATSDVSQTRYGHPATSSTTA